MIIFNYYLKRYLIVKYYYIIAIVLLQFVSVAQASFSYHYPFDSYSSSFRTMLVDRDTILLQGHFIDTVAPFLHGLAFAKIDSNGNLISYERYYDPKGRDLVYPPLNNMIKLSDGRYLTVSMSFQDNALLLIFLSPQFQVDTFYEYFADDPTVQINFIRSVYELTDGYLVFGSAQRLTFATDIQIFKVDKNGTLLWRKWLGIHNKDEWSGDICRYTDSTFLIGSFHKPFPVNGTDKRRNTWIFEVDENGNLFQEFIDPDPFSGTASGLNVDDSKNIYFSGESIVVDQYGQHNAVGRVGMLNNKFELQWKQEFGKNLSIMTGLVDMIQQNDYLIATGRYIDTSRTSGGSPWGYFTGWTVMTSLSGDSICERFDTATWFPMQNSAEGIFRTIDTLSSGSIIACGDGKFGTESAKKEYAWLVKMPNPPCEGLKVGVKPDSPLQKRWYITPNPSNGSLVITFESHYDGDLHFMMFDSQGRKVNQFKIESGTTYQHEDTSQLPAGTYLLQSVDSKGRLTGIEKVVLIE